MAKRYSLDQYVAGLLAGERVVLSRAITLTESTLAADQELAQQVLARVLPHTGQATRIGITGAPGVGKSTFIEALGTYLIENHQKKIAVLAIDPSSQKSGGSILGDKTRMTALANKPQVYIRPSPAGRSLGGGGKAYPRVYFPLRSRRLRYYPGGNRGRRAIRNGSPQHGRLLFAAAFSRRRR